MPLKTSPNGVNFIKGFEKFVPFVYDDLRPNHSAVWKDGNKYGYKEWDGGPVLGTLTIGYGHTDAAKHPLKCVQGTVIDEATACDILAVDLGDCEATVNRLVKVQLTQSQFDALVSFEFNSGGLMIADKATGKARPSGVLMAVNARRFGDVPAELAKWTKSKGQQLGGLVRRRNGEIELWNTPDALQPAEGDVPAAEHATGTVIPDAPPAPKPLAQSKTLWGLFLTVFGWIGSQAEALAQKVEGLLPYAPWLGTAFVILMLIGFAWTAYGRVAIRQEHGV